MRMHRFLFPLCIAALFVMAAWAGAASPSPPAPQSRASAAAAPAAAQGFAGSDVCMACHGEVADHLAKTPHGSNAFARLATQGCESCHGPAAARASATTST